MSDDWEVDDSDGEEKADYKPDPATIVALYNKIHDGEVSA